MNKKSLVTFIIICLCTALLGGCNCLKAEEANKESTLPEMILTPKLQQDQSPFRIAVIDIDPYPPASTLFRQLVLRLEELGWLDTAGNSLEESLDPALDICSMTERMAAMDTGPYLKFVPEACYYLAYEGEEDIAKSLQEQAASAEGLDLIIAMGTQPGLFAKKLDLDIPVVVTMATDPVASGIVDSVSDSGDPDIWP
jgi:hypothetical protein